jgi:hypothetical protein
MKRLRFAIALFALVAGVAAYVSAVPDTKAVSGPYACTLLLECHLQEGRGRVCRGCCGEQTSWGQTTLYVKCQQLWCTDVTCGDI